MLLVVNKDSANVGLSKKEIELVITALNERSDFLSDNLKKVNRNDFIKTNEIIAKMESLLVLINSEKTD